MKKTLVAALCVLLCTSALAEVNREKRETTSFNAIEVGKGANISLIQCDKEELEVVTDGCPLEDVETTVKKGTLVVKMKRRTAGSAVQVFVYFKDINSLEVKSGASAQTDCNFKHKGHFMLVVGSRSEATLECDVDEIEVDANSCDITLAGTAQKQVVGVRGTLGNSKYDASSLKTATVDFVGSSVEASVWFTDKLVADVQSGTLKYKGDKDKVEATVDGINASVEPY